MNKLIVSLTIAAVWMAPVALLTQAPAAMAAPKAKAAGLQGRVTALDLTKSTMTVTNRKDPAGTALTLSPTVKVTVTQPAMVGDIKVSDSIEAFGAVTPGATTISANRIAIQQPAARHHKAKANAGYHKNGVQGVVATTTPALTITTPGGTTVTVNTMPATQVSKVVAGTTSDIAIGKTVQVRTTGTAPALTATEVRVLPAAKHKGGKKHKGHHGRKTAAPAI